MKKRTHRSEDSTFGLNLAPMLDIIVSVTPMLLLSVAFIQVNTIDSPLPQAVQQAIENQKPEEFNLELHIAKAQGFRFVVREKGQKREVQIPLREGKLDLTALRQESIRLKGQHPTVFRLDLIPDADTSLDEIVQVMDQVRKVASTDSKFSFLDQKTGQKVETDLMFPNAVFANVMGE